jgi:hypothetical protein
LLATVALAPRREPMIRRRVSQLGITERGVKKAVWFHEDEAEALG